MALHRNIAVVDLARQTVDVSCVPGDWREKYLGGRSLAVYLYCKHAQGGIGALSVENPVVIGAGLLCGTLASPVGFATLTAKNPVSGAVCTAVLEGPFAAEMRRAGFDHLVVAGRSKHPVSLWVRDGEIVFRDARGLWGLSADATRARISREAKDESIAVCCIGTDGENREPSARVTTGPDTGRESAGTGAAWGARNLKAVVCRGRQDIQVKFPLRHIEMEKSLQPDSDPVRPPKTEDGEEGFSGVAGEVSARELTRIVAESLGISHEPEAGPVRDFWETCARRLRTVTGLQLEDSDLKAVGYRCAALERLLHLRDGVADPERAEHYRRTGWTRPAVVKRAKVFQPLGIDELWTTLK